MFNISFAELLIIITVFAIFTKPEDIKSIIHNIKLLIKTVKNVKNDILQSLNNLDEDAQLSEFKKNLDKDLQIIKDSSGFGKIGHTIGKDGQIHEIYDITDIQFEANKKKIDRSINKIKNNKNKILH